MMLDKEDAMGLVDQVNWLRRRADNFREFVAGERRRGVSGDEVKELEEEADRLEVKAQLLVERFFFPEMFAIPADPEEASRG